MGTWTVDAQIVATVEAWNEDEAIECATELMKLVVDGNTVGVTLSFADVVAWPEGG